MNNKIYKKLALGLAVCAALCTTAFAAPKGKNEAKPNKPPAVQKAPDNRGARTIGNTHASANRNARPAANPRQGARPKAQPAPPAPKVAKHNAAKPNHQPRHDERYYHENTTLHTEDWICVGATLVGGILGGLIGAAL